MVAKHFEERAWQRFRLWTARFHHCRINQTKLTRYRAYLKSHDLSDSAVDVYITLADEQRTRSAGTRILTGLTMPNTIPTLC